MSILFSWTALAKYGNMAFTESTKQKYVIELKVVTMNQMLSQRYFSAGSTELAHWSPN
jgi:hypothetical protein